MEELKSWQEERQSSYLYNVLAQYEKDSQKKQLFEALAKAALEQATMWEKVLRDKNISIPVYSPNLRTHITAWFIRNIGPKRILPMLAAMKVRGISIYTTSIPEHPMPKSLEDVGQRHHRAGTNGNLRAAVFGVNDGLVSNASLIMGMAGATMDHRVILVAGVAGLLAGAFSMAAGEYVSVRSQREMYEYQIGLEEKELELYPEEEKEELALIYEARGLSKDEADKLAAKMMSDPKQALDALTREELGLNPNELGSPIGAASSSFISFTTGALIPLVPFLFGAYHWSFSAAIILTGCALFIVGMVISLFTGKNALFSGLRMLLIGSCAGAVTYLIGHLLGVNLS